MICILLSVAVNVIRNRFVPIFVIVWQNIIIIIIITLSLSLSFAYAHCLSSYHLPHSPFSLSLLPLPTPSPYRSEACMVPSSTHPSFQPLIKQRHNLCPRAPSGGDPARTAVQTASRNPAVSSHGPVLSLGGPGILQAANCCLNSWHRPWVAAPCWGPRGTTVVDSPSLAHRGRGAVVSRGDIVAREWWWPVI